MSTEQQTETIQEGQYTITEVDTDPNTLAVVVGAEIDMQIATAKKFPRSLAQFKQTALSLVQVSQEVAESCEYGLPRGNKIIKGPSVRLAEIIQYAYGNMRAGSRIVQRGKTTITAQGVCFDLERNIARTIEVTRSIMEHEKKWDEGKRKYVRTGRMVPMNEDMQVLAANAAASIAIRNAVFQVVPKAAWWEVYQQAIITARGDVATLPDRRAKAMKWFAEKGIKEEQIFHLLEVKGVEDIDLEKLSTLSAIKAAVVNNEASLKNLFPETDAKDRANQAADATAKALNKKSDSKKKTGNPAADTADKLGETLAKPEEPK